MGRKKKNKMPVVLNPRIIVDTNQVMIDPAEPPVPLAQVFERETPDLVGISSKKRKRLEKYIESKLKKERRIRMLKSLEESSLTSAMLLPTKNGASKMSRKQRIEYAKMQRDAGLDESFEIPEEVVSENELEEPSVASSDDAQPFVPEKFIGNPFETLDYFEVEVNEIPKEEEKSSCLLDIVNPCSIIPTRLQRIQQQRQDLPVYAKEQEIVDLINRNPVVIICGETGSGKTTQVPQFLYEYGYGNQLGTMPGMIGITQPRRVATVAMANRVAEELNVAEGIVSHQVRYDSSVSSSTTIKFMTDGILLREISGDFLLSKYSAILVDEAHERNLNTDLLIGLLSRIVKLRLDMSTNKEPFPTNPALPVYPLRLIIMSATLRVDDFANNPTLFDPAPPILNVEGKLFKVDVHFSRKTPDNYCKAAYKKACEIHNTQPQGGILVFLTGKHEIKQVVRKLKAKYPLESDQAQLENEEERISDDQLETSDYSSSSGEEYNLTDDEETVPETVDCTTRQPLFVVPLYSMMSPEQQQKIFQEPPEGCRLVVVATNIAETSITIPNIKYVVDCGKIKEKTYQNKGSVQKFTVNWISKAAAEQRTGRAGRVSEGHCYRLYSSAVFEREFLQFSLPEIRRIPIESMILSMKAMHIDNVVNFPFPSPPAKEQLVRAQKLLCSLEAIDKSGCITALGREMSRFPVHPRLSRMLLSHLIKMPQDSEKCLQELKLLIYLVATMSIGEFFVLQDSWDELPQQADDLRDNHGKFFNCMKQFGSAEVQSDHFLPLVAYISWLQRGKTDSFCNDNFIRAKSVRDVDMLVSQLCRLVVQYRLPGWDSGQAITVETVMQNQRLLMMALLESFNDQMARLLRANSRRPVYIAVTNEQIDENDEQNHLLIHPSSVFFSSGNRPASKFVIYTEIQQSYKGINRIRGITSISSLMLKRK